MWDISHYFIIGNIPIKATKKDFSYQNRIMNFWENVVEELEFQGKTRKELAAEIGFDASNIGKGEKNGNIPAADAALKIAHSLGVSLYSLLFPG